MGRYKSNLLPIDIIKLKSVVSESGCWLWNGTLNAKGYGCFSGGLAHRFSYQSLVGEIPEGRYVLHHCDIRNCVNPQHLYVGTQKDNVADMWRRGRANARGQKPGEGHSLARLTWNDVREIRALAKEGKTKSQLAIKYGISEAQIGRIILNVRWIDRDYSAPDRRRRKNGEMNYSKAQEIRSLYALGTTGTVLAKQFSLSIASISRIVNNKVWREAA